jgi:LysM repeat protein
MDPAKYGFVESEMNFQKEYKYDVYVLNEPLNLESLAKAADIPLTGLKELNPELIRNCTPIDANTYYLKIPESQSATFASNLEKIPYEEKKPYVTHILENGENLRSISDRFNISKDEITVMNKYSGVLDKLDTQSQILLPITQRVYDSLKLATKVTDYESITANSGDVQERIIKTSQATKNITHKVAEGENLYVISQKYGVNLAELKRINNIDESGIIKVGQNLIISDPNVQFVEQTSLQNHKVESGETFATIAEKYNITVADLKKINKIKQKIKTIKRGKTLKVPVIEVVAVSANGETITSTKIENSITKEKVIKEKSASDNKLSEKPIIHKVRNGESLDKIAAKYDCTVDQIKEWNPDLVDGDKIFRDTKLKVYSSKTTSSSSISSNDTKSKKTSKYKIKNGDTLSSIADKFGCTVKQLQTWNNIKDTDVNKIVVGRTLTIK